MKAKTLCILLTGGLLALAAWSLHAPIPAQIEVAKSAQQQTPNPTEEQPLEIDYVVVSAIPEKYRDTVRKGLEYLVKNQFNDGHWQGDGGQHPVAMTGLAGLALLMESSNQYPHREPLLSLKHSAKIPGKHSANFRKAVDWLMAQSQAGRDGLIFSGHPSEVGRYMEGHGLATIFLAGASENESDPSRQKKLVDVLTRATKYIVKAQSTQGGWYHTSKAEGHDFDTVSATAIQVQALQAAENAGIPVPDDAILGAHSYLRIAVGKIDEGTKPGQRHRMAEIAAALAAARFNPMKYGTNADEVRKTWLNYCKVQIPVGRSMQLGSDEVTHYYYAQAVFNLGGTTWSDYRTAMFDHLQLNQNQDGSWPAGDGISIGRVYSTAAWCTILLLDRNCHPSAQHVAFID